MSDQPTNPKPSTIVLRCKRTRKAAYVRAANARNQTLADWMFATCDAAAGYDAKRDRGES